MTTRELKRHLALPLGILPALLLGLACNREADSGEVSATACEGKSGGAGQFVHTLESSGMTRAYRLFVPTSYDPTRPTPLVLNYHGLASNATNQEALSNLPKKAEQEGFITAAGEGSGAVPQSWNGAGCCPPAMYEPIDDVQYTRDLVDDIERDYCLDRKRIFATGMSNGGFMSNRLACDAGDLIAAVAPVAAVLASSDCSPSRPVPILMFNGTLDPLVKYEGGSDFLSLVFPPVETTFRRWAEINGCTGDPETTYQNGEVTCTTHCGGGATTSLCAIEGGGHTWPGNSEMASQMEIRGAGHTTLDIDATDAMWEFFVAHPRP